MADQDISRDPDRFEDKLSQAVERALFGTSQHLSAVIDSNRWQTRQGRAEILTDVRKRMETTSYLIDEWLEANRPQL
jgi:hypothetical protein